MIMKRSSMQNFPSFTLMCTRADTKITVIMCSEKPRPSTMCARVGGGVMSLALPESSIDVLLWWGKILN